MGVPFPKIVPSYGESGPHLTHGSLGPSEPTTQTASRSICRFCTDDRRVSLYFTMGRPLNSFPSKFPLAMDVGRHLMPGSLGPPKRQPKRHLDRFSRFWRAHYCDRPIDRHTTLYSVGNNRAASTYRVLRCGLISFIKMHKGRLTTYNASRANKINVV